jgi:hypothetical protein
MVWNCSMTGRLMVVVVLVPFLEEQLSADLFAPGY